MTTTVAASAVKQLPTELRKNTFTYTIVKRGEKTLIYKDIEETAEEEE